MKFEKTDVWGFKHAIRGMRLPMQSGAKSDSFQNDETFKIGTADMQLMQKLIRAGSEHRKFMRQIFVSVDITAPLYWWKEFDTYKVGTVANSESTMHKLASTPITRECFECGNDEYLLPVLQTLETLRKHFGETKEKRYWKELVCLLPSSWLQKRTVTMSYENVYSMIKQRESHKLSEWSADFMSWAKTLPHALELFL